ncbi:hypothetical protein MSG28_002961 [Choristoneura fumiferana]|uniref:Uncharacterized protein n=1 Tax=Choristoneura fumiferana TaxID=7141 RepID=A0ACC0JK20_CHOFU|nr:hypothetical protein MSG28_002961 [Choristoneura fumiferana]
MALRSHTRYKAIFFNFTYRAAARSLWFEDLLPISDLQILRWYSLNASSKTPLPDSQNNPGQYGITHKSSLQPLLSSGKYDA